MTETEKMLAGKIYDPSDIALLESRERAHAFCRRYNGTDETDIKKRRKILDKLLPNRGEGAYLQGPVFFDYGIYFKTGKNFYANFNLTVLDCCSVTVGDNVFIGPNCSLVTPRPPLAVAGSQCPFQRGRYALRSRIRKAD